MKQSNFLWFSVPKYVGSISILCFLLLAACNNDDLSDKSFTIGDELVETSTQIVYIDTLSVNLSTVILDSVLSSYTYRMLVGNNTDGHLGSIFASSYFEVTPPYVSMQEEAVYDSITLILGYDGYSYGDTLQEQTLSVHALSETIETHSDGYLYNTSAFAYNSKPLGQLSYSPRPSDDEIEIRLSDSLGEVLFQKLLNNDDEISSEISFLEYFPGLHLKSSNEAGAVIGFSAIDTNSYIILHYHEVNFEREELSAKFLITNQYKQFNNITVDRTGTNLESWEKQRYDIPSNITDEEVYLQGGTGVLTRVEFPSLEVFIEMGEQASLLKAEIIFEPVKNTYGIYPLPVYTTLFQTDGINRVYSPVYSSDGATVQTGAIFADFQYHEQTSISFEITDYLRSDFLDNYYDENYGFLLGLSTDVYYKTLDRLVLGTMNNESNQPSLRVYYMLYD